MFNLIKQFNKSFTLRVRHILIPSFLISFLLAGNVCAHNNEAPPPRKQYIKQLTLPMQTWALELGSLKYQGYNWFKRGGLSSSITAHDVIDDISLYITATREIENINDKICFDYFVELNKKRDENFYFASLVDGNTPYFEYSLNLYKHTTGELVEKGSDAKNMTIGTAFAIDDACVQILASDLHNEIFYNNRLKYFKKILSNIKINKNYKQTIFDNLNYGNFYFDYKNFEDASKYFDFVLNTEKDNPQLNEEDFTALITKLSRSYIDLDNLKKAKEVLLFGVNQKPDNPLFYYYLAVLSAEQDDFNATFKNLWKAYTHEEKLNPFDSLPDPLKEKAFQKYVNEGRFIEYLYSLNKRHLMIKIGINRNYSVVENDNEYYHFDIIEVADKNQNQFHLDGFGNRFYKENYNSVASFNDFEYEIFTYAEDHQGNRVRIDGDGNIYDTLGSWRYENSYYEQPYEHINFIDGIGVVSGENEKYHVDIDGNRLYEETYIGTDNFKDGIAPVRDSDGLYYYIDTNGKPIFNKKFKNKIWPFYQNRARVTDEFIGSYHINREGNRFYSASYDFVDHFYEDRAKVKDFDGNYFHLNLDGRRAYPQNYMWVDKYSEGFARVKSDYGNWYHIDKNGRDLYRERYDWVGNFVDGIAPIQNHEGIIKYIDTKGNLIDEDLAHPSA